MRLAPGGLLFDFAPLPGASFLLMTVLTVLGILVSLGLPNMLVARKLGESAFDVEVQKIASPLGQHLLPGAFADPPQTKV
jgi:hypothetical protein